MAGHTGNKIQSQLSDPEMIRLSSFDTYFSYLGSFLLIKEETLKRKLAICPLTHKPICFKRVLKHRTCLPKVYSNQYTLLVLIDFCPV